MYRDKVERISRWVMGGTITTETPLHVGSGERPKVLRRPCRVPDAMRPRLEAANPEYAAAFTGHDGKPVIPATRLKGALRAWALANLPGEGQLIEQVFGTQARGGVVTFFDGQWTKAGTPAQPDYRFWSEERGTLLTPQVAIDARLGSAQEGLLYYVEYVPAGTEFSVRMQAQNASDEERELLVFVLENAFRGGVARGRLGSDVANGWGDVRWKLDAVSVMEAAEVKAWLAGGGAKRWDEALRTLGEAELKQWRQSKFAAAGGGAGEVTIRMRLKFSGPMLVNDPTRQKRADGEGKNGVGHAMLRDTAGRPLLPPQSVRGALRGQMRRIWQTLAWGRKEDATLTDRKGVGRKVPYAKLAAFYRLVGATGWRSPMEVSAFRLAGGEKETMRHRQEFVAVDRFTGGAANQKKFSADGLIAPVFEGTVKLRPDRWEKAGVEGWGWLMLTFALRDWMEGDGRVGFGASKGYGAFRAEVEVSGPGEEARIVEGVLKRDRAVLESDALKAWEQSLRELTEAKSNG